MLTIFGWPSEKPRFSAIPHKHQGISAPPPPPCTSAKYLFGSSQGGQHGVQRTASIGVPRWCPTVQTSPLPLVRSSCNALWVMLLPTPRVADIWLTDCPWLAISNATLFWCWLSRGRLPNRTPRSRADASPSRVRSLRTARSQPATDAKTPTTRLPAGVLVAVPMSKSFTATPLACRSRITVRVSAGSRPIRSKRATASVSTDRRAHSRPASRGRVYDTTAPEMTSSTMRSRDTPACMRSRIWGSVVWSTVETRA